MSPLTTKEKRLKALLESMGRDPGVIEDVLEFHRSPTEENWQKIYAFRIQRKGRNETLWQWVLVIDPTFPRSGSLYNSLGNRISGWSRIPTPEMVERAIIAAS